MNQIGHPAGNTNMWVALESRSSHYPGRHDAGPREKMLGSNPLALPLDSGEIPFGHYPLLGTILLDPQPHPLQGQPLGNQVTAQVRLRFPIDPHLEVLPLLHSVAPSTSPASKFQAPSVLCYTLFWLLYS